MVDTPLSRRDALRLTGLLATGAVGCQEVSDGAAPTSETTSPAGTPTEAKDDGTATAGSRDGNGESGEEETETATDAETPALDGLSVTADRVAAGFTSPVGVEIPDPGRRFVVDQPGQIYLQDGEGLREEPYLDISDRIVDVSGYDERGLLGLAFHPEFADNGQFFVRYSAPSREGTPDAYAHTFVLSEFGADPEARAADPGSERTVMEIPQPQGNHNAGAIAFGPDGHLYVATGDGGAANDDGQGHVDDWYDANPGGNGQDVTENLLGGILRIDVDADPTEHPRTDGDAPDEPDGKEGYAIPDDNPLVGEEGLAEHYAWGFRNPWRMSFGAGDRLFVADVGQGAWEEVSVVEKGGNYGWNVKEGTHCFGADDCPDETPDGDPLIDPVIEYPHGDAEVSGVTVIGGYLYDGEDLDDFQGLYVFADWRAGGELFAARDPQGENAVSGSNDETGLWPTATVDVESDAEFGSNVLSFGRNPDGELFVCTTDARGVQGSSGAVFRLRSA